MNLLTKTELETYLQNYYSKIFLFPEVPYITFNIAPDEIDININKIKEYFSFSIRNKYQYLYIEQEDKFLVDDTFFIDTDPIISLSEKDFIKYFKELILEKNKGDILAIASNKEITNAINSIASISIYIKYENSYEHKIYTYKKMVDYYYDTHTQLFFIKKSMFLK